jgi:hypothetical protein
MSKQKDLNQYLKQYPEANRWLNQCIICQSIGYKPEMPEKIHPGYLADNLRKMLSPLEVNELRVCSSCANHLSD